MHVEDSRGLKLPTAERGSPTLHAIARLASAAESCDAVGSTRAGKTIPAACRVSKYPTAVFVVLVLAAVPQWSTSHASPARRPGESRCQATRTIASNRQDLSPDIACQSTPHTGSAALAPYLDIRVRFRSTTRTGSDTSGSPERAFAAARCATRQPQRPPRHGSQNRS